MGEKIPTDSQKKSQTILKTIASVLCKKIHTPFQDLHIGLQGQLVYTTSRYQMSRVPQMAQFFLNNYREY